MLETARARLEGSYAAEGIAERYVLLEQFRPGERGAISNGELIESGCALFRVAGLCHLSAAELA